MANSPSLVDMGLLKFDNTHSNDSIHHQQHSLFSRSLSNAVAPVNVNDQSWRELFDLDYDQYPATRDYEYWSTKSFDNIFTECQSGQGLTNIFDDFFDGYYMGGDGY
jgi:hypothetical protein